MADAAQSRHPAVNEYRLDVPNLRRARFRTNFAEVASRRRRALHLHEGGLDLVEIGLHLAADPLLNASQESTPSGYGWYLYVAGKPPPTQVKLGLAVGRDLDRGIEEARGMLGDMSKREFDMSLRRLNRLIQFSWKEASEGSHWHVFRILQIEERRAKMWGWDSERKVTDETAIGHGGDTAPAATPDYTLEYVEKMYGTFVEAGFVEQSWADDMIGAVREIEAAKNAEDGVVVPDIDVVDAVVVEDSATAS